LALKAFKKIALVSFRAVLTSANHSSDRSRWEIITSEKFMGNSRSLTTSVK